MISPKTAQAARYAFLFLILLILLPFDLAFISSLSLYLFKNSKNYTKLIIASIVLFLTDILLNNFDISIRFISDLAIDAYILLLTSLFIFLKSDEKIRLFFQKLAGGGRKIISRHTLSILGVSSIFSLLFAPIIGIPFAVICGYISFSYLTKHFEGRYAYIAGLFFLALSPLFIIAGKDNISENLAIISFFFLIIGTIQEVIKIVKSDRFGVIDLPIPKFTFPRVSRRLYLGIIVLLSFLGGFYILMLLSNIKFSIPQISLGKKTLTPLPPLTSSPSALPTIIPSPILNVTTESARLKILVHNGTDITGLAASTAAKLKKVGFTQVNVGDASKQDYQNWELITKVKDEDLLNLFKNILELSQMDVKEATVPAGFDILIIAGKAK